MNEKQLKIKANPYINISGGCDIEQPSRLMSCQP